VAEIGVLLNRAVRNNFQQFQEFRVLVDLSGDSLAHSCQRSGEIHCGRRLNSDFDCFEDLKPRHLYGSGFNRATQRWPLLRHWFVEHVEVSHSGAAAPAGVVLPLQQGVADATAHARH
jgi:hypothetical protein